MALDFTSGTGHLFNRLGALFHSIGAVQTYQGTTMPAYVLDISNQYDADLRFIPTLQGTLTSGQGAAGGVTGDVATIAQNTLVGMVQEDTPQPQATLDYALPQLIAQMVAASATVRKNIVTITSTAGAANNGNGTCLVRLIDGTSTTLENVYAETFTVTCTQDAQPGNGAVAGQEQFTALGDLNVGKLDFTWPKGSGGQNQLVAASAAVNASAQNVLTNGNFETFTVANIPDNWTITVGTAGTTVKSVATPYIGVLALSIVGNGSELTKLTQILRDTANNIDGIIQPQTVWAIAFYCRVSSVPSGGVLRVSLQDGSGTVVGSAVSVTLSGATTGYVLKSAMFSMPLDLPAKLVMTIELTTALDNTKAVYVDELVLTQMTQYANGPFLSVIPGNVNFIRQDVFNIAVTNDKSGQFQTWFNRVFDMDTRHLVLPSATSGAETIPDSLIA